MRQEVGIQDRTDQRKGMVSSMNDCNVLRFVLEVRVEIKRLPTSPISPSMDENVLPQPSQHPGLEVAFRC